MPTDQYFLMVFDQSPSHNTSGLVTLLRERAATIPALCKVVRDVPGHLDTPVWAADVAPAAVGVVPMTAEPTEWSECLDRVSDLLAEPLDAHVRPWTLHVACDVRHVPQSEGPATVVLARLNHALTDGGGGAALMRALFAPVPDRRDLDVAADSRRSGGQLTAGILAVAGLLRRSVLLPLAATRFLRGVRRAGVGRNPTPGRVVFNGPTGGTRQLTVLPVPDDLGDGSDHTKTQLVLTAISLAMQRYVERHGERVDDLVSQVTVRIRDAHRWHGTNRFLPALISLATAHSDIPERVRSIAEALVGERRRLDDPRVVSFYRLVEAVPIPLMRRLDRMAETTATQNSPIVAHTTVTSIDCGDGKLELGGARLRFISGFPALSATIGLGHGLYGAGGALTVGVLSSPETLPEPVVYAELLSDALDEVAALAG